jgi:hypothetical protein
MYASFTVGFVAFAPVAFGSGSGTIFAFVAVAFAVASSTIF